MNHWVAPGYETGYVPAHHVAHSIPMYGQPAQSQPNSRMPTNQVDYLREQFANDPKPSTSFKRHLAALFEVDIAKINNWFQNERAKTKNERKRAEQQAASGESASSQDTATPSSVSSSSPALSQPAGTASRPAPPTTLRSSSSTELRFDALDLEYQPQSLNYTSPTIHNGMMSAPAHISTFDHQIQPSQSYSQSPELVNWLDHSPPTTEAFSANPMPSLTIPPQSLSPSFFYEIQPDMGWSSNFSATTPTAYSEATSTTFSDVIPAAITFNDFAPSSMGGYDEPLLSSQIDGTFPMSMHHDDVPFYSEHSSWANLPQLSPSESHNDQSGSESLPVTPAPFLLEQNTEEYNEAMFMSSGLLHKTAPTSPAMNDQFMPLDYSKTIRSSSTNPSSFTKKRAIKIPHLSLEKTAMPMSDGKLQLPQSASLRTPQSAGFRTPRSPLHPIRDESRRVSKASPHTRPSGSHVAC